MRIQKRLPALFLAICLTLAMNMPVCAHEAPDLSRTGVVSVTMIYDGQAVPGGRLTLYRVGEIREDDGNYSFVLTGDFKESGVSLKDPESSGLAASLAEYALSHGLKGTETGIGNDGKATVAGLTLGLYLVIQNKPADGFEAAAPFLISVPMNEDGTYIYEADASPKVELVREHKPSKPSNPENPDKPGEPSVPSVPGGASLPQTGQLNWPVPVLTVLGLGLFTVGWILRFGNKRDEYAE